MVEDELPVVPAVVAGIGKGSVRDGRAEQETVALEPVRDAGVFQWRPVVAADFDHQVAFAETLDPAVGFAAPVGAASGYEG